MAVKLGKVEKKAKSYEHVLIIMRHAKAEPFGEHGDRDRPLADKGLKQAKAVGKGLLELDLVPNRIACSGALRTQQTCEKMLKTFGDVPKVDYRQSLYDGGMQAVLDELAQTKDKHRVLMILGHEPTMSIASQWLASPQSDHATLDQLNLGLSTASVAIFGSNKSFSQWKLHEADLLAVITPNDFD